MLGRRDVISPVQQTPDRSERQEESVATTAHVSSQVGSLASTTTTAHVSSQVGPPASSTSHRFPRSAHNKPCFAVPIDKKEEHAAMCVSVNHNGDSFDIYVPHFLPNDTEFAYLSAPPASAAELEKWKLADLSAVKSLVLEHNVWDVCQPPGDANLFTSKWVIAVKNSGIYKSRLCSRGFNMIHGVDYNEIISPLADVERMLRVYLLDNPPGVVLSDDVSATTVEIYDRLPLALNPL